MNLHLCIVSATPDLLYESVRHAVRNVRLGTLYPETGACWLNLHVFANVNLPSYEKLPRAGAGSAVTYATIDHSPENVGCTMGMHGIWERRLKDRIEDDDLVVYIHDDLNILEEGWDDRVRRLFQQRPQVMLAGFGGARQLGDPCLYKVPYQLQQLARFNFASNMTHAEIHGRRTTTDEQAATLDSFTLILRGRFLRELDGWSWWPYPCHNFDNAVSCEAKKRGYQTWLIPVYVEHKGGQTSCGPIYQDWAKAKFGGDVKVHADSHVELYERYRGILPIMV